MTDAALVPPLKPCPFCGASEVDPEGWLSQTTDGLTKLGPECLSCGATAVDIAAWNRRAAVSLDEASVGRLLKIANDVESLADGEQIHPAIKLADRLRSAIAALKERT
jgi:hypothetical protein